MIPVLAVAAVVAGCGGSGYGSSAGQPAAAQSAETAKKLVDMTDSTFAPKTIDAKVGDTITFVNQDEIAHNATGEGIDSGTIAGGATFDFKAAKAGTISYVCTFHPGMTGSINVT
jgi:plastocyanin